MTSAVEMASNALLLIGDDPISAFTEPGAGAQAASNLYESVYTQFLSEHPWSFAFKEQFLNRLSQMPDSITNYKYAYQVPTDVIRLWAVLDHSDYVIVGNLLYSNQSQLFARYVYRVEETRLPPHAVQAIQYKLASDFAIAVTEDANKNALYERKYTSSLARARNIDSQSRPQTPIIDSPFVDARMGGYFS